MSAIRITGVLGRRAEAHISPDGTAWLSIEIHQTGGHIAVSARRCMGKGPAAQIAARSAANHLRTGVRVTVHAARFDIAHSPSPHLVLLDVDHIEHQAAAPRHEPAEAHA